MYKHSAFLLRLNVTLVGDRLMSTQTIENIKHLVRSKFDKGLCLHSIALFCMNFNICYKAFLASLLRTFSISSLVTDCCLARFSCTARYMYLCMALKYVRLVFFYIFSPLFVTFFNFIFFTFHVIISCKRKAFLWSRSSTWWKASGREDQVLTAFNSTNLAIINFIVEGCQCLTSKQPAHSSLKHVRKIALYFKAASIKAL